MADYWIKLYHDILDDPKMAVLPDNLWRRIIELFLFAGKLYKDGNLPDTKQIAWCLRQNENQLADELEQITQTGIISKTETGWFIPKFRQRQAASTSTERSQQYRKKEIKNQYSGDKLCGIYKITCLENGMSYIGSSVDIEHRIKVHFYEAKFNGHWLYDDLKKYGRDKFTYEILEAIDNDDDFPIRETYWIGQYRDTLYNTETKGKLNKDRMGTNMQRNVAQITDNRLQITDADTEPPPPKNNYLLFTQEIGLLTPSIADFIDLSEKELTEEWVHDAILEASSHNARTVAYIKKILETWKKNGRKSTNPQRLITKPIKRIEVLADGSQIEVDIEEATK